MKDLYILSLTVINFTFSIVLAVGLPLFAYFVYRTGRDSRDFTEAHKQLAEAIRRRDV